MADKLSIGDNLKYGKQEILLDPTKTANKCGYEVDALLANDLMVERDDGTYVNLVDYITQENLRVGNLQVTATGTTVTIRWDGEPTNVEVKIDDVIYQPTGVGEWSGVLAQGTYTVVVKALHDFRGITETFTVTEADAENVTITYN